ncbi:MAG: aminotransferase class I/II-fold pyridoxal phosphate-dependent enzyme [candidate division Zixibacteria bacterium]|nr:aminotransferase class I/II-fold pyridoxal phosphate-dependent enzyme [candidate division Zixibacteria bacterium]
MKIIDLRSDTVTRPSAAMRQAMVAAEVGDDVFGDDPTVKELESHVARLFEREASLYVPSGTMANQIALNVQSRPGWELLCERECHLVNYEGAAPVLHSQLLVNLITTEYGMIPAETIRKLIRPRNIHCPETKMVALENTHNHQGGTILPLEEILRVRKVCDEFGLVFHLDGARIWNVHVATGISLPELTRPFDSVTCCLSKGLGAPIGSMIVGSSEFIEKCRRRRKILGGGMRQVGIIAAAGLYAVKNNIVRLAEDHANAGYLAGALSLIPALRIDMNRVQTNIILVDIVSGQTAEEALNLLKTAGVLAVQFGPRTIRLVTHLDVSRADCEEAAGRIKELFAA